MRIRRLAMLYCLLSGMALPPATSVAGDLVRRDLSDAEKIKVAGSSVTLAAVGRLLKHNERYDSTSRDYRPPGIDSWFRRRVHGDDGPRTNFLDSRWGSAASPAAALTAMALMDIGREEFSRDIPLFLCGVLATKGITDITKNLVRRPRPCCVSGVCPEVDSGDDPSHGHAFFSGHASSAFFTSTFFNRRVRHHMRRHWTADEYRVGRVVSPLLTFGWATFVGLSRIHADRHYFTDVAAGALVGAVMGELFFRIAYEKRSDSSDQPETNSPLFVIRIPIN